MGVARPLHCCKRRWSLTPPFHPCQLREVLSFGGIFLWPFTGRFPRPGGYPAFCSVECGLSSAQGFLRRDHPTDLGLNLTFFYANRQFDRARSDKTI